MRSARGDVSDHIVSSKSITDLRSGVERRRGSREVQRSTFARFLGLFDFRLLQPYRPGADIEYGRCEQAHSDLTGLAVGFGRFRGGSPRPKGPRYAKKHFY